MQISIWSAISPGTRSYNHTIYILVYLAALALFYYAVMQAICTLLTETHTGRFCLSQSYFLFFIETILDVRVNVVSLYLVCGSSLPFFFSFAC